MEEAAFYNAAAVALEGSIEALAKARARHGSWERAYRSLLNPPSAAAEWEKLRAQGVRLIMQGDPAYPPLLKEIPGAPFGIYVKGDAALLGKPSVAIVGTRKATPPGLALAESFAADLARRLVVVSGLALGIDAAAHKGCLEARGKTAAVLATGLDRPYPEANARLAKEIISRGGALVSEYPLGSPALPYRFLERNRIVSGLAKGIVVIEAPLASGALNTARCAAEQGRGACVVPGPASHPNYRGAHALIREGAALVTCPAEVLEELGFPAEEAPAASESGASGIPGDSPEETRVLAVLAEAHFPLHVDKIAELSKLNTRIAASAASLLVIKGRAKESSEGFMLS